ncbi:hypothetical protein [Prescottella equi]|uniref:hypothetical protein n=1 Tax=Rhodococcus hoagii TaxID=43767 RepID=UPI001C772EF9|nr:hypothetical protein [Prescottella equi]BCN44707.1 hypothetical protein RE9414_29870 [Prescottella equi]
MPSPVAADWHTPAGYNAWTLTIDPYWAIVVARGECATWEVYTSEPEHHRIARGITDDVDSATSAAEAVIDTHCTRSGDHP